MLAKTLSKYWWMLLVRGIAAVLFGIFAYAWPGITLAILLYFFIAYVFVSGVVNVIHAFSGMKENERWWVMLIEGILEIAFGILAWRLPGATAVVLLLYIAFLAISGGVARIALAIRIRKEIKGEWLLVLGGIVSILLGLAMIARPALGALAVLYLVAAWAIILGGVLIGLSFRVKRLGAA